MTVERTRSEHAGVKPIDKARVFDDTMRDDRARVRVNCVPALVGDDDNETPRR